MMKLLKKRGFAWICALFMILVALSIGASSAPGAGTKTPELPDENNPMRDTFVRDDAGVLSAKTESTLNGLALALREGDHPQFAVYTSDKEIKNISSTAIDMRNVWEAYSRYNDIALMIVLDIPGDNYYSATSVDAQDGPLPDGTVDSLQYLYLEPGFAARDYDAGMTALCDQVYAILLGQKSYFAQTGQIRQSDSSPIPKSFVPLLAVGFCIFMYLIFYAIFSAFRWAGRSRHYGPYAPPRRSWWFGPTYGPYHRPPPPPPRGGRYPNWDGGFPPSGGRSSGGGAGRSSGGSSFGGRSSGGGAGRSSGGFSSGGGAGRSSGGGGGRSSGGGAGRR